jgi:membrane protein DedA with SNARE-associated domain
MSMPWRRFILAVAAGGLATVVCFFLAGVLLGLLLPSWPVLRKGALASLFLVVPPAIVGPCVAALLAHWPRDHETRCRKCGYILRGISEPRCPECGEQI